MSTCQSCSAPTVSDYLCRDCLSAFDEALGAVPELLAELDTTITRQDRLNTGVVGRSALTPSPINFGAAKLLDEITDVFADLVDTLCETNHLQFLPAMSVPTNFVGPLLIGYRRLPRGYSKSPTQCSRWLRHHVALIAKSAQAGEMLTRVTEFTGTRLHPSQQGRLWQMLGRRVRRFAGFCPTPIGRDHNGDVVECGTLLYGEDEDDEETQCPKCLETVDIARNRQRAIMSRDLLPEARIHEVLDGLGEKVCKDKMQRWLSTGRLQVRGYLHQSSIVERRISSRDARLLSLSQVRQLRWSDMPAAVSA